MNVNVTLWVREAASFFGYSPDVGSLCVSCYLVLRSEGSTLIRPMQVFIYLVLILRTPPWCRSAAYTHHTGCLLLCLTDINGIVETGLPSDCFIITALAVTLTASFVIYKHLICPHRVSLAIQRCMVLLWWLQIASRLNCWQKNRFRSLNFCF